MKEYLTYEEFGAVGDGVHDDMPAIAEAHSEAGRLGVPIKAAEGAVYFISPKNITAEVTTSADWTGARFIIDDRDCENVRAPIFRVVSVQKPVDLKINSLTRGQTELENPFGEPLYVIVKNRNHLDYIRFGPNQNNGTARTDNFVLSADGIISSPVSFDFDEVTDVTAMPIDREKLTLTGGEFTTIANRAESRYNYHGRNITVTRSNVEISSITHLVTDEIDHGAPYSGFISISGCADIFVHDCVFTGHYIYTTIGSAGQPVPMGSYDINCGMASNVTFARCSQTTDIMDRRYWGLIGTNFCRDLKFEDCVFSRFDAHQGVSNCTIKGCTLGWQCLNAIGNGTFVIEDTDAYGHAFVNLRSDYGSTWRGKMIIRNCTWHPLSSARSVFSGSNDGHHWFGYECCMPDVEIDGLKIADDSGDDRQLSIFNNYAGDIPDEERKYMPVPPKTVNVKNIETFREIVLCDSRTLMPDTVFTKE